MYSSWAFFFYRRSWNNGREFDMTPISLQLHSDCSGRWESSTKAWGWHYKAVFPVMHQVLVMLESCWKADWHLPPILPLTLCRFWDKMHFSTSLQHRCSFFEGFFLSARTSNSAKDVWEQPKPWNLLGAEVLVCKHLLTPTMMTLVQWQNIYAEFFFNH